MNFIQADADSLKESLLLSTHPLVTLVFVIMLLLSLLLHFPGGFLLERSPFMILRKSWGTFKL